MESNWVQQRAARNTLPIWRKKIRMAERVVDSALRDRAIPSPPRCGWTEIPLRIGRDRPAETTWYFVRCVEAFAIFTPWICFKSLSSSNKACSGWR